MRGIASGLWFFAMPCARSFGQKRRLGVRQPRYPASRVRCGIALNAAWGAELHDPRADRSAGRLSSVRPKRRTPQWSVGADCDELMVPVRSR